MTGKAHALHIGLNSVEPAEYRGWNGALASCENDAKAMLEIAKSLNYASTKILLTKEATKANFRQAVDAINEQLNPGDLFLLTFSGHGGQVVDTSGDEPSGYDQTWCFYDGEIIDDTIYELLKIFAKGVRVLIISDSCFSGSILKELIDDDILMWGQTARIDLPGVVAAVRLISSSQDTQEAAEGRKYGLFTDALLTVWDDGDFEGHYKDFYEAIVSEIPYGSQQMPNHLMGGAVDDAFDDSLPFTVPECGE